MTKLELQVALSAGLLALFCLSCRAPEAVVPTETPDYPVLETRVAVKLRGTLTAKAPTPTRTRTPTRVRSTSTPRPSATPAPTATPSPTPVDSRRLLAFARVSGEGQAANVLVHDLDQDSDTQLTHFLEPLNMSDVTWSQDGQWILFVSAHDFIHSRDNERNVFMVRPDGSELHMVTGDYLEPAEASGPYVALRGRVEGGVGTCLVCAQGSASLVSADDSGEFELAGVSLSAEWVRAVCQDGDTILQGDIDLVPEGDDLAYATIPVTPKGQGWRGVSMSHDGRLIGGLVYEWKIDDEGQRDYVFRGVIHDGQGDYLTTLELPAGMEILSLSWSPRADQLVGTLTAESSTLVWLWDADGASQGVLIEISNPESEILSAISPAWSPDGSQIAFGLRRWYWWGDNTYRTDLMLVSAAGEDLRALVENDWGADAGHPSWAADGSEIYYELLLGEPGDDFQSKLDANIWSVPIGGPTPMAWTSDNGSYTPAVRPKTRR